MRQLVELKVDETPVLVEIEVLEAEQGILRSAVNQEGRVVVLSRQLGDVLDDVRPTLERVVDRVRSMAGNAQEISVEFGVAMSIEGKAFIARGALEANFKISLTWNH